MVLELIYIIPWQAYHATSDRGRLKKRSCFDVIDAQKLFTSTVSSLLHTNSSHFPNPLILIFWPTWSYLNNFHHHSHHLSYQFHIISHHFISAQNHFISTQDHLKSTQNHPESSPLNLKHIEHPKSIIIYPTLGIFMALSALETY